MKELFGVAKKRKDGSDGLVLDLPPIEELQRGNTRDAFIKYSAKDAEATWQVRCPL
jgi:DNA polymerase I